MIYGVLREVEEYERTESDYPCSRSTSGSQKFKTSHDFTNKRYRMLEATVFRDRKRPDSLDAYLTVRYVNCQLMTSIHSEKNCFKGQYFSYTSIV